VGPRYIHRAQSMTENNLNLQKTIAATIVQAIKDYPPTLISPHRMTEEQAAAYCGRSKFWLRNLRRADDFREAEGGERLGPPVIHEGRTPFYMRESVTKWLDAGGLGARTDALVIRKAG